MMLLRDSARAQDRIAAIRSATGQLSGSVRFGGKRRGVRLAQGWPGFGAFQASAVEHPLIVPAGEAG